MHDASEPTRRTVGLYFHIGDATDMLGIAMCTVIATRSGRVLLEPFESDNDVTAVFRAITKDELQAMVESVITKVA